MDAVFKTPQLLRQLDADGDVYPVVQGDLKSIIALIHATPDHLSQRMKLIEPRLVGDSKTVLTTEPSRLRRALLQNDHIQRVALWALPYDARRYQSMVMRNPDAKAKRASLMYVFEGDRPLAMGRRRYFQGSLNDDPPKIGAKSYFMDCRIPDKTAPNVAAQDVIDALERSGLQPATLPEKQLQALQQEAFNWLMRSKRAASYWLALLNFEDGKYQVALDYLEKRVLTVDKGSWLQGAHYNLGRAYERLALAERAPVDRAPVDRAVAEPSSAWQKARQHYLADKESPQYAGNWIRAQRIEKRMGVQSTKIGNAATPDFEDSSRPATVTNDQ